MTDYYFKPNEYLTLNNGRGEVACTPFIYPDDEIEIEEERRKKQNFVPLLSLLLDLLGRELSHRDVQIILAIMLGRERPADLARTFGITRQAINDRLKKIQSKFPKLYDRIRNQPIYAKKKD